MYFDFSFARTLETRMDKLEALVMESAGNTRKLVNRTDSGRVSPSLNAFAWVFIKPKQSLAQGQNRKIRFFGDRNY